MIAFICPQQPGSRTLPLIDTQMAIRWQSHGNHMAIRWQSDGNQTAIRLQSDCNQVTEGAHHRMLDPTP